MRTDYDWKLIFHCGRIIFHAPSVTLLPFHPRPIPAYVFERPLSFAFFFFSTRRGPRSWRLLAISLSSEKFAHNCRVIGRWDCSELRKYRCIVRVMEKLFYYQVRGSLGSLITSVLDGNDAYLEKLENEFVCTYFKQIIVKIPLIFSIYKKNGYTL